MLLLFSILTLLGNVAGQKLIKKKMILKWWTLNDIIAFFGTGFFKRHWRSFCWCWVNLSFSHHTTVKPVKFFFVADFQPSWYSRPKNSRGCSNKYFNTYEIYYTLFMCQVEISIRDSNIDPRPKFRSETQISIRNEIEISFRNPNFDSGPKFESRIEIDTTNFLLIKLWKILLSNLMKVSQNFV